MTARPFVTVQYPSGKRPEEAQEIPIPDVFASPIRRDIVQFVFTNMSKNNRQAYAVSSRAGHQTSAHSWGTGRAAARIPRVGGGGTHRSGQAAIGNMTRGGRMFAPTKVFRRWHRRINLNQRRYAVCSALAATSVPSLVMARGHHIEKVEHVPLVVSEEAICSIEKTKDAVKFLKEVNAYDDIERVEASRKVRAGQGKHRNRRNVQRKGPLMVYMDEKKITKAFRNIPGVELCRVTRLNLLQLAPGGHLGRFIIWTEAAFKKLNEIFGTEKLKSLQKAGYQPPTSMMTNPDISRIINSQEVQSALRPKMPVVRARRQQRGNPLNNKILMRKLNPYSDSLRRKEILKSRENHMLREKLIENRRKGLPADEAQKKKKEAAKKRHDRRQIFYNLLNAPAMDVVSEDEEGEMVED